MNTIRRIREGWLARSLPTNFSGMRAVKASYAMFGEDALLRSIFRTKTESGTYVDIGCYHPQKWSNTYAFYIMGWRGLCVDPNKDFEDDWRRLRPKDIFLPIAISDEPGTGALELSARGPQENRLVSRESSADHAESTVVVRLMRLDTLLNEYLPDPGKIDLMSIDCEGHDLNVLRSNDFEKYRPRILVVEDHGEIGRTELHEYCTAIDYQLIGVCGVSRIYKDSSQKKIG